MLYEYRVYETLPGRLPNINARFRDHTMKIFEKHGIKNIGYFTADVGDYSDRLIYISASRTPPTANAHGRHSATTPNGRKFAPNPKRTALSSAESSTRRSRPRTTPRSSSVHPRTWCIRGMSEDDTN